MSPYDIIEFLRENRETLLMDQQFKHCVTCHGPKLSMVYRNPKAAELGRMLDSYEQGLRSS